MLRAHVRAKVVFDGAAGNPASFDNKAFAKLVLEGGGAGQLFDAFGCHRTGF